MENIIQNEQNNKKFKLPKCLSFLNDKNSLFYYFIFLVFIGFCFLGVSLITSDFTTPFSGDYVSQQFAFYTNGYDDWWHFFKTGEFILYDENTYLGANNIGSNSFYYLFDPFFMPILLCPREYIPQGMAILTIFKIALAGLSFYFYMRYFKVKDSTAKITGLAYAFCGWVSWYLWFNHFTEIAICLPLILLGVEKTLQEKKPVLLGASLFLLGITNYFFLMTFTLLAFIYAMVRYFQRLNLNSSKDNLLILGLGFIGFLSGLMMSAIVVLPSIAVALTSPRAGDSLIKDTIEQALATKNIGKLIQIIFTWTGSDSDLNKARGLYPFIEFFFPTMTNRGTPLIKLGNETYDNVAGSIFCYTPITILLVPSLIKSAKDKKYSHLAVFFVFLVALCTPFSYYIFHGFTQTYSRWTLFVSVCLIAYVGQYLDKIKEQPNWHILVGGLFTIFGIILGATSAVIIVNNTSGFTYRYDLTTVLVLTILYTCALIAIIYIFKDKKQFEKVLTIAISCEAVLMGVLTIFGHGLTEYKTANNGVENNNSLRQIVVQTEKNDNGYYRSVSSLADDQSKNDGLRNGFNSVSMYHSIYNYNLIDFLDWVKLTNTGRDGWSSTYLSKSIGLDNFLGVKYRYVLKKDLRNSFLGQYQVNVPNGYVDISNQYNSNDWLVYENKNHIEFAFTYDSVMKFNSKENEIGGIAMNGTFKELNATEKVLQNALFNYKDYEEIISNYPNLTYSDISIDPGNAEDVTRFYNVATYRRSDTKITEFKDFSDILDASNSTIISKPSKNEERNIIITIELTSFETMYDPNGNIVYLSIPYNSNHKTDVYLVDENDNLITYDRHNDDRESRANTRKKLRAFYTHSSVDEFGNFKPAPKLKKVIIVPRYAGLYSDYPIAIGKYQTFFDNNLKELNTYKIENFKQKTNEYSFTTNFSENRVICTQLAYEKGFNVKAISNNGEVKNIKPYIVNGGFLGFVSEKGETKYVITFNPPLLKEGAILSISGLFIYLTTNISYLYITNKNKKKDLKSL